MQTQTNGFESMATIKNLKLNDYKKILKNHVVAIDRIATNALGYGANGACAALNKALLTLSFDPSTLCTNENTANAVLCWVERKAEAKR